MLALPMQILLIEDESNRAFIERLYMDNRFMMFIKAMEIVRTPSVAEDIVSDVCMQMIEKIDYLRGVDDRNRRVCIIAFVRNKAVDYARRKQVENRHMVHDEWVLENAASDGEIDDEIIRNAEVESLMAALDRLDERNRDLLEMKYWRKLPDAEIAKKMGIQTNSVRQYLTNAKRKVRRIMEEDGINE